MTAKKVKEKEKEVELEDGQYLDPTGGDAFQTQEDIDNLHKQLEREKKKVAKRDGK